MKVAVIGAGNMGGAIVRGLLQGSIIAPEDVRVANPSSDKLELLRAIDSRVEITTDNRVAVEDADCVILAVKPWLVEKVIGSLDLQPWQMIVSIAAGVTFDKLIEYLGDGRTIFRVMPNTAISEMAGMTLVSSYNASPEQEKMIMDIFGEMGRTMLIPESKMTPAMILASCGMAYVLKYIHAATEAGVEMGISPHDAMTMVAQSVEGAAKLLLDKDTHPALEIDKVTTPGGVTIRGLNALEHAGFSSAVIRALKACLQE